MRQRKMGLSSVEALMGLAISMVVFAGIAVVVQAGTDAASTNQDFSSATQAGRVGLNYIISAIRRSDPLVSPGAGDATPATAFSLSMNGGVDTLSFQWDRADGCVYVTRNDVSQVLARNVSNFQCRRQANQGDDGLWRYSNYQISMTMAVGEQVVSFSESTLARRAMAVR